MLNEEGYDTQTTARIFLASFGDMPEKHVMGPAGYPVYKESVGNRDTVKSSYPREKKENINHLAFKRSQTLYARELAQAILHVSGFKYLGWKRVKLLLSILCSLKTFALA